MFLFTTSYVKAAEFSQSTITNTCRVQESIWKKKQCVCVWLWEFERLWSSQSGPSSCPISKYLAVFNGKPKENCSSIYAHGHVCMNMCVCTVWKKLLRHLMSGWDALIKVPSTEWFINNISFCLQGLFGRQPNQVLRICFLLYRCYFVPCSHMSEPGTGFFESIL